LPPNGGVKSFLTANSPKGRMEPALEFEKINFKLCISPELKVEYLWNKELWGKCEQKVQLNLTYIII